MNKAHIPVALFKSGHCPEASRYVTRNHRQNKVGKFSHIPIKTTDPIHFIEKVMTKSPGETILFDVDNNMDL